MEDCQRIQFAPVQCKYDGIGNGFSFSGLDRTVNNWDKVDDFNWLASDEPNQQVRAH